MSNRTLWIVSAVFVAASAFSTDAAQQLPADPKARGREVTAESIRRGSGFGDTRSEMTMVLMSDGGTEVTRRTLRMSVLEGVGDEHGDKSIIYFDTPKDVQGTVLLTHTKIGTSDDQWIYIPAISRLVHISPPNKSGPFLGSEFAYEDLAAQELRRYDYLWLRDEACPAPDAARQCAVIERRPLYEFSGYNRQICWIDMTDYQLRKIEFYNRQDRLLKTLTLSDYRLHDGRFWRPHQLLMINHSTGRSTRLDVTTLKFGIGLTDEDFTEQAMLRLR